MSTMFSEDWDCSFCATTMLERTTASLRASRVSKIRRQLEISCGLSPSISVFSTSAALPTYTKNRKTLRLLWWFLQMVQVIFKYNQSIYMNMENVYDFKFSQENIIITTETKEFFRYKRLTNRSCVLLFLTARNF